MMNLFATSGFNSENIMKYVKDRSKNIIVLVIGRRKTTMVKSHTIPITSLRHLFLCLVTNDTEKTNNKTETIPTTAPERMNTRKTNRI